jgi:putative toxin-antitoxin system antitoxin component (TIGR02293 family)
VTPNIIEIPDAATSDRSVRLARILALAVPVLESRANAIAWLREPNDALGGRSPLEAVASDQGAERVSNMLYQMGYCRHPGGPDPVIVAPAELVEVNE